MSHSPIIARVPYNTFYGNAPTCALIMRSKPPVAVGIPLSQSHLIDGFTRNGISISNVTPFDELSPVDQQRRFTDLLRLDFSTIKRVETLLSSGIATTIAQNRISLINPNEIESTASMDDFRRSFLEQLGDNVFREGKIARCTLAAGAASRFKPNPNDTRPKALFEITDSGKFKDETYLSIQAKDILSAQEYYGTKIPWFIFVHPSTRANFEQYLVNNEFFGLQPENIGIIEHTGEVPYFTVDSKIAREKDASDWEEDSGASGENILFGTSGHGFFAHAFRHNPIYINGKKYERTAYKFLSGNGIETAFISNIDNLGARISSNEYRVILGSHIQAARNMGRGMTVELVPPLIIKDSKTGDPIFWDAGGIALRIDGHPQIVDTNVLTGDALRTVTDPANPFPFNTANATFELVAISEGAQLPPTIQNRRGLKLFETNFWNITSLINAWGIIVPRDIPQLFADPESIMSPVQIPDIADQMSSRFIPTKKWGHRYWAAGQLEWLLHNSYR